MGANKNSIKIIGEDTDNYAQGYFVYDSKKSGSTTTSHLRFGPRPIHSTYLITSANFVACHQWFFLEKFDVLKAAIPGATFLLNSIHGPDEVWGKLPRHIQEQIIAKKIKLYVIDGYEVAQKTGMGGRVNTIMQTAFFAISGVLPREEAIEAIKASIKKTYGRKGDQVVQQNYAAVDQTLANLHQVKVPATPTSTIEMPPIVAPEAPDFVRNVTAQIWAGFGESLPVSAMPVDGTFPTGTAAWEKRNIALEIPVWDMEVCIQCNKCVIVCPHATIRAKVFDPAEMKNVPATFKSTEFKGTEYKGMRYSIQVAPEDCTGCALCVEVCPAKNKTETRLKAINMMPQQPLREAERVNYDFFLALPEADRRTVKVDTVKGSQFLQPLFEYSGACSGCGETPYVKLVTQLFGDRTIVANATGCSSIYGANLPTTPWSKNNDGRGPAWANSLFEDNAEFGMGMRLTVDKHNEMARELVQALAGTLGDQLVKGLLEADQSNEAGIYEQRQRVAALKEKLAGMKEPQAKSLLSLADSLVKKSIWIMGGDGWAYDIGYGGLDHVLASGKNVNILVMDTEVYSNTGGQMSKATPRSAVAKFAAGGKPLNKKDLGRMALGYGNVYVAVVAMGYNDLQTIKAFLEAEAYDGPSLIIAYSHCIAHGIDMAKGMNNQKAAVDCGPLGPLPLQSDARGRGEEPPQARFARAEDPFRGLCLHGSALQDAHENQPQGGQTPPGTRPGRREGALEDLRGDGKVSRRITPTDIERDIDHGSDNDLHGAVPQEPDRPVGQPALSHARRHEASRRRRRLGDRDVLALRGADRPRIERARPLHAVWHRKLRRVAQLLPGGRGVQPWPRGVHRADPQGEAGAEQSRSSAALMAFPPEAGPTTRRRSSRRVRMRWS